MIRVRAFNDAGKERIAENKLSHRMIELITRIETNTLTKQDKEYITRCVNDCTGYGICCIPVMGVLYDFSDILKTYVYKQQGAWHEAYACDKTTLRATICGTIDKIVEVK